MRQKEYAKCEHGKIGGAFRSKNDLLLANGAQGSNFAPSLQGAPHGHFVGIFDVAAGGNAGGDARDLDR